MKDIYEYMNHLKIRGVLIKKCVWKSIEQEISRAL